MRTIVDDILKLDAKQLLTAINVLAEPTKKASIESNRATLAKPLIETRDIKDPAEKERAKQKNETTNKLNNQINTIYDKQLLESVSLDSVVKIFQDLEKLYMQTFNDARALSADNKIGAEDLRNMTKEIYTQIFDQDPTKSFELMTKLSLLMELRTTLGIREAGHVAAQNIHGVLLENQTEAMPSPPSAKSPPTHKKAKSDAEIAKEKAKIEKQAAQTIKNKTVSDILVNLEIMKNTQDANTFQSALNKVIEIHMSRKPTEQMNMEFNKLLVDCLIDHSLPKPTGSDKEKMSLEKQSLESIKTQKNIMGKPPTELLEHIHLFSLKTAGSRILLNKFSPTYAKTNPLPFANEAPPELQSLAPRGSLNKIYGKKTPNITELKAPSRVSAPSELEKVYGKKSSSTNTVFTLFTGSNSKANEALQKSIISSREVSALRDDLTKQLDQALTHPANNEFKKEMERLKAEIQDSHSTEILKHKDFYKKIVEDLTYNNEDSLKTATAPTNTEAAPAITPTIHK